jgi:hypothetical protein
MHNPINDECFPTLQNHSPQGTCGDFPTHNHWIGDQHSKTGGAAAVPHIDYLTAHVDSHLSSTVEVGD